MFLHSKVTRVLFCCSVLHFKVTRENKKQIKTYNKQILREISIKKKKL